MITSTANPRVKAIRALRRRKERDARAVAYIEGIRPILTAIDAGAAIDTLIIAPDLLTSPRARDAVARATNEGIPALEVTPAVFRSLSDRDGPQGLAAVIRQRWTTLDDHTLEDGDRWVALTAVADPGNLGTILRTCDAAAAEGVILLEASADPYDPTALRASTGAVFTRRLVRATWPDFTAWARRESATVTATADNAPTPYRGANYGPRSIILMGSEREGLTADQQAFCDQTVAIPMRGSADSLNLAVATALVLYELLAQHESAG